jgi:hypothetical protein
MSFLTQDELGQRLIALGLIDTDGVWLLGATGGGGASDEVLTADPVAPDDDTWWVVREGTSPAMTLSMKARIAGSTVTIASVTL